MASFEKTLPQAAALPVRLRRPKERILKFREEILLALDTLSEEQAAVSAYRSWDRHRHHHGHYRHVGHQWAQ